jgi:hypothetical protein
MRPKATAFNKTQERTLNKYHMRMTEAIKAER